MGGLYCCVAGCKNSSKNSDCKFYRFPMAKHKLEQRSKWISAVNKINSNGPPWSPAPHHLICSAHFVGNKKSEEMISPSYVPTIFPSAYKSRKVNEVTAKTRHDRFMKRRIVKDELFETKTKSFGKKAVTDVANSCEFSIKSEEKTKFVDEECQVYIFLEGNKVLSNTFECNRYIFQNGINDVEIQTELVEGRIKFLSIKKKFDNKKCGTPHKTFTDQATEVDFLFVGTKKTFGVTDPIKRKMQGTPRKTSTDQVSGMDFQFVDINNILTDTDWIKSEVQA